MESTASATLLEAHDQPFVEFEAVPARLHDVPIEAPDEREIDEGYDDAVPGILRGVLGGLAIWIVVIVAVLAI